MTIAETRTVPLGFRNERGLMLPRPTRVDFVLCAMCRFFEFEAMRFGRSLTHILLRVPFGHWEKVSVDRDDLSLWMRRNRLEDWQEW